MLRQAQHERWDGALVPHPAAPAAGVGGVIASVKPGRIDFTVVGPFLLPPPAEPVRTDGLWRTTCFELFIRPEGGSTYFEFNFSPSTAWAAYRFDSYREGMVALDILPPLVMPIAGGVSVQIDLSALPPPPWHIGLSAVIEETDGTKSYWALAHPPGTPDFHHDACFALQVPALGRP